VRHLNDNFEFVLCEVGTAAELCDAQRGCCVCRKWAAKCVLLLSLSPSSSSHSSDTDSCASPCRPESVACARCARVFHLTCVDPPLAAKPKAGYGWSCAPCSKAHDEEVEGYAEQGYGPPPVRKAAGVVGVGMDVAVGAAPAQSAAGKAVGSQMLHGNKKGKARQGASSLSRSRSRSPSRLPRPALADSS